MADYLLGLTQRTLGVANTLQPLIPSMFEAGPPMANDPTWDWQTEPLTTDPIAADPIAAPLSLPLTDPPFQQPESAIARSIRPLPQSVPRSGSAFNLQLSTPSNPTIAGFTQKSTIPGVQISQPFQFADGIESVSKKKD